MVPKVHHNLKF